MLSLPSDAEMLVSYLNMKLRDNDMSLRDLLEDADVSEDEIVNKLAKAGYKYNPDSNQFR